jgi:hypothetical protein
MPSIWTAHVRIKNFLDPPLKSYIWFKQRYFSRCENSLAFCPGPDLNLMPGAGLNFLTHFRQAHAWFKLYAVCSLENILLTSGCHVYSKPANFLPPPCHSTTMGRPRLAPPQERQVDTHKPVLCDDLRPSTRGQLLKGRSENFLNMVAAHIKCLFDSLFSCQCPFKHCSGSAIGRIRIRMFGVPDAVDPGLQKSFLILL